MQKSLVKLYSISMWITCELKSFLGDKTETAYVSFFSFIKIYYIVNFINFKRVFMNDIKHGGFMLTKMQIDKKTATCAWVFTSSDELKMFLFFLISVLFFIEKFNQNNIANLNIKGKIIFDL